MSDSTGITKQSEQRPACTKPLELVLSIMLLDLSGLRPCDGRA